MNEKTNKKETYNLKNKDAQKKFKEYTNNTKIPSSVLDSEDYIDTLTKRLVKKINGCIAINFKKVRINTVKKTPLEKLMKK